MRSIKFTTILLGLLLFSCIEPNSKTASTAEVPPASAAEDKMQLQNLVRRLYKWYETKGLQNDFDPLPAKPDTNYTGLNMIRHTQRIKELKATGFFADEFLANYDKMARTIDNGLKKKTMEWKTDDLPPFGNGGNPWCNCQDTPENYWQTMTVTRVNIEGNVATFAWTWGDDTEYKVKAVKEGGDWKISYLQGFDFDDFLGNH